jgi:hypothetical protein
VPSKPPPTPCQRCKAELKEALRKASSVDCMRREVDRLRLELAAWANGDETARANALDARLVAAVNKHDEDRRAWQAERERLQTELAQWGESVEQGRAFWNRVDEGHPAHELLVRLAAGTWQTSDLALPRDVKEYFASRKSNE